jgi:DNA topoisomerase-2
MTSKNKIVALDPREHVLLRPDMYIGSIKNTEAEFYKVNTDSDKLKIELVNGVINYGLHRIFVEILSNAIDNVFRSENGNTPSTTIKINIDKDTGEIVVWNDGNTILVEKDEKSGLYYPELAFGNMLAGSNFNDKEKRMTSGRNGLGATVTSIFSKSFSVETYDPVSGNQFVQKWTDNMKEKSKPKITTQKK